MDQDKASIKTDYDYKHEQGKSKFFEYVNNNKIKEWVDEFLPFIDDNSKQSIIKCYSEFYNNAKIK
jgi:hypothetical protein